jgi:hypothetical protein
LLALSNVVSQVSEQPLLNKEIPLPSTMTVTPTTTSPVILPPPTATSPSAYPLPVSPASSTLVKPVLPAPPVGDNSSASNVVAWFKDENYGRKRTNWKAPVKPSSSFPLTSGAGLTELSFVSTSPQAATLGTTPRPAVAGDLIHDHTQAVLPVTTPAKDKRKPKRKAKVADDTESDSDYGDDFSSESDNGYSPRAGPAGDSSDPDSRLREALNQIDKLKGKLSNLRIKYKTLQEQHQQSKGKREIRNANACDAHKKRHQKCPDNCPGRLQLMQRQQQQQQQQQQGMSFGDMSPLSPSAMPPKKRGRAMSPPLPGMKDQPLQA